VTELTQPLAAVSAETDEHGAEAATARQAVTFADLVYAHFDWWRERRGDGDANGARRLYEAELAEFELRHGQLIGAYWCSKVQSAVALTEQRKLHGFAETTYTFHRESDWATHEAPDVAAELHRCDELAVRARIVLSGVRRRICLQLVLASAAHLLSLVDERARHADEADTAAALARERAAIAKAEAYYHDAANGQAQMVYFGGMAAVALILGAVAAFWLSTGWSSPVAALIAGAIGAVVSVVQRINSGKFDLEYDVGAPYAFFLGGLRPLIGGALATAISFAFLGGLLHLPVAQAETDVSRRLALVVVAFVAGFSERWAQDTLTSVVPAAHTDPPKQQEGP
jgi:hypothetical protein